MDTIENLSKNAQNYKILKFNPFDPIKKAQNLKYNIKMNINLKFQRELLKLF